MRLIKLNDETTLAFLIDYYTKKGDIPIDQQLVNKDGKSHLHLIIMPNNFGWIHNEKLL